MTEKLNSKTSDKLARDQRLKQALKANMGRRKVQAKARAPEAGADKNTNEAEKS